MQWTDEGIVLGIRRHGEANAILELMTREHGRHLGLVRGGAGSRLRPVLQPGNRISATWRARLDEHLGHYTVEGLDARAASFLPIPHALYGVTHLAALCRLLPERDPHPQIACRARRGARQPARSASRRARCRAFRIAAARRARLRSRSRDLRGDRQRGRSRLCVAEIGPRGVAPGGRAVEGQAAARCRHFSTARRGSIRRRRTSPTASR